MGKAARWFRGLLGGKRSSDSATAASCGSDAKEKKKWGLVRSLNHNDRNRQPPANKSETRGSCTVVGPTSSPYPDTVDPNKHAIAVAAATAAVAEAALAAAEAAAAVVRLTSGGSRAATAYVGGSNGRLVELAAVKIQSAFRGYLARRALRALQGLVKLQALVRGHIVRKQSADMFRRMQALVRAQSRARLIRAHGSESSRSSSKSSRSHHPRCGSKSSIKDITDLDKAHLGSNWLDHWMEECSWNNHRDASLQTWHAEDEKSDKILEVDTWKPQLNSKQNNRNFQTSQHVLASDYKDQRFTRFDSPSKYSTKSQKPISGLSSGEVLSLRSRKFPKDVGEASLRTAENSPQFFSASSRPGSSAKRGPFTPTRSECSRSFFSRYLDHPNYMANTESSRAKFRSQSAPRQRIELEKPSSTKRDAGTNSQRGSVLQTNFRGKAYSGSGRLDRLVLPVQGDAAGFNRVYGNRC